LVYINGLDGEYKNHTNTKKDGIVVESKQLWAFGNYSRFVRPGMKRVNVTLKNYTDLVEQAGTYMVSGYKDEKTNKIVLVAINMTNQSISLPLSGLKLRNNQFTAYTTDDTHSLFKSNQSGNQLKLEAKSVTTLVGNYE
jgi:alpha-L-arabinofuranosidase